MAETIGARVRKVREELEISRADLARSAGIAVSTLSDLELGESKSSTALHRIAARLAVDPNWLETGRGVRVRDTVADYDPFSSIPAFAAAVGLSDGEEADEYATTYALKFRKESLRRKHLLGADLAVIYGKGDSMEPVIATGDAILFNRDDTTPRHEELYVVQVPGVGVNDAISVKQCELIGSGSAAIVTFRALNPGGDHHWRVPRLMDDARTPITVIGKVCWLGKWT